jgi:uncharacterized protein YjiS (DUF1127 family)
MLRRNGGEGKGRGREMTGDVHEHAAASGFMARLAQRARDAIDEMRQRHALRRELADCDMHGGLDETLGEIGVSRAQIPSLIKGAPRASHLLGRMAAWLGVDLPGMRDPALKRELQRVCSLCQSQSQCRHWLEHPDGRGHREFCPNAETLDELRPTRGA